MKNFQYVNMPDYFTRYLQQDMQVGSSGFKNFKFDLYNHGSLKGIYQKCFTDIDAKLDVDMIFKSLGWMGVRNRIASIYLNHTAKGFFDKKTDVSICDELVTFERSLEKFSVYGYSRGFLLGMYLKMWGQTLGRGADQSQLLELFEIAGPLLEILQRSKSKVIKIDWVVVTISQLLRYLNKDIIVSVFSEQMEYKELYQILSEEQKEEYISNLLNYGSSIGDDEIFLPA